MEKAIEALINARTIAVVGLDNRQERPAYRIASYLQGQGYRIIPVPFHQQADEVLGEKAYPSRSNTPATRHRRPPRLAQPTSPSGQSPPRGTPALRPIRS